MTAGGAIGQANAFFGNVVKLAFALLLGGGGWLGWQLWNSSSEHARELAKRDAVAEGLRGELRDVRGENASLKSDLTATRADLAASRKENERLALANRLLKIDRRVARVVVLDQTAADAKSRGSTRVKFEEVDGSGNPIGSPRELTIEGDTLYVEGRIVKFADTLVEANDPLRSASLFQFQRLYGEHQAPDDGVVVDASGTRPAAYGISGEMSELEQQIWRDFWQIANDPKRAAPLGVRAAHGEAVFMRLKKGEVYVVTLRSSDGLTFQPDRPPPGSH